MDTSIVSQASEWFTNWLHSNMTLLIILAAIGAVIFYAWENMERIKEHMDKINSN